MFSALRAPRSSADRLRPVLSLLFGPLIGVFILHPAAMVIYWVEWHQQAPLAGISLWSFVGRHLAASFTADMLPMTGMFAALGGLVGGLIAWVDRRWLNQRALIDRLEAEIGRDIPTLIALGESERVEFKETARWDVRRDVFNKALGDVIAKTIAAFANHRGGTLLIGVSDSGEVTGLDRDYSTLKSRGRDGFEQLITSLVRDRLGGEVCRFVHTLFARVGEQDVCRVLVEPASQPVYFSRGGTTTFLVRTGNGSRVLDARETVSYVSARWPR